MTDDRRPTSPEEEENKGAAAAATAKAVEALYLDLGARGVDWATVTRDTDLPRQWFQHLPEARRNSLLLRHRHYARHLLNRAWVDCLESACYGTLESFQYAHEHGSSFDTHVLHCAVVRDRLEILEYMHEHDCPWDETAQMLAAWSGSLRCMQYMHEHGCPWDSEACRSAAMTGQLECLRYLREHGCPWNRSDCLSAAYGTAHSAAVQQFIRADVERELGAGSAPAAADDAAQGGIPPPP